MKFLQSHGYRVIPVNPQITGEHVHGEYVWRELSQIGEPIDLVDIFRRRLDAGRTAAWVGGWLVLAAATSGGAGTKSGFGYSQPDGPA